jgi:hypothetical protein
MKKVLASFLAVGLMAAAANAEIIGLRWADTPGVATHNGAGTVEVFLQMEGAAAAGSHASVSGVIFTFSGANAATPADANLVVGNYQTSVPSWVPTGVTGGMSVLGTQFVVSGLTPLQGPGNFVLGTFDVDFTGPADLTTKPFTALIPQDPAGLLNGAGSKFVWNNNTNTGPSGYGTVAFEGNFGNPGWGTMPGAGHEPTANPLFITKFPEPTSLALIALGGMALLRRRS